MDKKRVTIRDISEELGVSYAIINRALNNKSGVSEELRAKILATAQRLGYRQNKVAKSMARATITLGIIIPTEWEEYFSVLKSGITEELDLLLDYNVVGKFYTVSNSLSPSDTVAAMDSCIEDGVNGIILCDFHPRGLERSLDLLRGREIPVAIIGDADGIEEKYLTAVRTDARLSGRMAAEILCMLTPPEASLVAFVGNKDNAEHRDKAAGFTEEIRKQGRSVLGVYETQDDEEIAARLIPRVFSSRVHGVYLATSGTAPVADFIKDLPNATRIVATDTGSIVARGIEDGRIQCTIYQNPRELGRRTVRAIYEFLSDGVIPEKKIYIKPEIVIRSNLLSFINK